MIFGTKMMQRNNNQITQIFKFNLIFWLISIFKSVTWQIDYTSLFYKDYHVTTLRLLQ